jgi:hypothetical protein
MGRKVTSFSRRVLCFLVGFYAFPIWFFLIIVGFFLSGTAVFVLLYVGAKG